MTKPRVLVVDADLSQIAPLVPAFRAEGFDVFTARDSQTLESLLKSPETFDALIGDFVFPPSRVIKIPEALKTLEANRQPKLFLLSSSTIDDMSERDRGYKVYGRYLKPVDPQKLARRVKRYIPLNRCGLEYSPAVIKACVGAMCEVIEHHLRERPSVGKPFIKTDDMGYGLVTAMIPISQKPTEGSLALGCSQSFVELFAEKTLKKQAVFPLRRDIIKDLVGELCNQVCGRLKANLARIGYQITSGLPKIAIGENHLAEHLVSSPPIAVPVSASDCGFQIEFCLGGALVQGEADTGAGDGFELL